jgi:fructose-1,6-bisphosphatase/sedoheptulose 1,7-bisphosphatase-like protein
MHQDEVAAKVPPEDCSVFRINDLVVGDSALFRATGITDNALVPGIRVIGHRAETHSILMRARSRTVRTSAPSTTWTTEHPAPFPGLVRIARRSPSRSA